MMYDGHPLRPLTAEAWRQEQRFQNGIDGLRQAAELVESYPYLWSWLWCAALAVAEHAEAVVKSNSHDEWLRLTERAA